MPRLILRGLSVSEFIHPDELRNKAQAMKDSGVQKILATATDWCKELLEPFTQGTFVKLNNSCAPDFMEIVRNVCIIMEVEVPEVYVCHLMSKDIMPMGTDQKSYIVVPDFVFSSFDNEMLYYNIGNAITMIKAEHVGLTTLAAYMPGGSIFIDTPKMLFCAYLHAADATSDRGGLLASQSFAASVRSHFLELGIPPKETRKLFTTDAEAELFVEHYLEEHEKILDRYNTLFNKVARQFQRMSYIEAPANKMLRELFEWYKDPNGYRAVLLRHGNDYL